MKRRVFLLLPGLLLSLLLAGCSTQPSDAEISPAHPHVFTEWSANLSHHWFVCECGEKADLAKHTFDEDRFCAECGYFVYDYADGTYGICVPDEHGSIVRQTDYDSDGNVISEMHTEIAYYDDGNPQHIKEYVFGELQSESHYLRCETPAAGDVYLAEIICYYEDGTREIVLWEDAFFLQSVTLLDSVGTVITQELYEYLYDNDGNCLRQTTYVDGVVNREIFYEADGDGYFYESKYVYYNESGEIETEYRFDEYGNEIS